jgi:hypothetical protein
MKWNHLPVAGGIYNQDPDLLLKFDYIFRKRAEQEEREQTRREREQKRGGAGRSRVAGKRR